MSAKVAFRQELDLPVEKVRAFFSDVRNLRKISPPFPRMKISYDEPRIIPGAEFRIRLHFGIGALTWVSRIEGVAPDGRSRRPFPLRSASDLGKPRCRFCP